MKVKCKEPGCGAEIKFVYTPTEGVFEMTTRSSRRKRKPEKVKVYLTCENDHTNSYVINVKKG